jgi:CheY-like chemotaxis protein
MPPVLALIDDLLFLSRVREAARGTGVDVRPVRRPADAVSGVREGARLVVVDADSARLPWREVVAAVRAAQPAPRACVVAFVSHVHADHAAAARAAGCDRVLARSAFVLELPALMAGAAASPTVQEEPTP